MNSTNPIYVTLLKVSNESQATVTVVASFTKELWKNRATLVECTEKLHRVATVATLALATPCDLK